VQRPAPLADEERLAGRLHPGADFQPRADGPQLVAPQRVRGRESALQPGDVQDAALDVHLVEPQPAGLGDAQPVAEHQEQQAAVAGLVPAPFGGRDQPLDLAPGEVLAAASVPAFLSGFAPARRFVESSRRPKPLKPL
jgi:hypothetical protein